MAQLLAKKGYQTLGVDLHAAPHCLQANIEQLPLKGDSCDLALLLDVLEHVDDRAALQEAYRIIRPGGWVILTVPAHGWLWSPRDDAAGHRRRYSHKMVRQLLQSASLEIEQIGYFQCLLFPLFILSRLWSRALPQTLEWEERTTLPLLTHISLLDARLAPRLPLPFGSTLFAIGKKHATL
jgi:SAM-dependent methyltransferase